MLGSEPSAIGPRRHERPGHREVLFRKELRGGRRVGGRVEERRGEVVSGKAPAVLRQQRRAPGGIVHVQLQGLAEQQVVVELLDQELLAEDRAGDLRGQWPRELPRDR